MNTNRSYVDYDQDSIYMSELKRELNAYCRDLFMLYVKTKKQDYDASLPNSVNFDKFKETIEEFMIIAEYTVPLTSNRGCLDKSGITNLRKSLAAATNWDQLKIAIRDSNEDMFGSLYKLLQKLIGGAGGKLSEKLWENRNENEHKFYVLYLRNHGRERSILDNTSPEEIDWT